MGFEVTDDELVRMSTSELRLLLAKRQLTPEEHRQLRSRRRRLQNRKYARKCAHKKLTEVENLTTEVEEETTELQVSDFCLFSHLSTFSNYSFGTLISIVRPMQNLFSHTCF